MAGKRRKDNRLIALKYVEALRNVPCNDQTQPKIIASFSQLKYPIRKHMIAIMGNQMHNTQEWHEVLAAFNAENKSEQG